VETLAPIAAAANSAPRPAEQEIGAGVASGELPHAQACVLYLLRIGVIEQLSEAGQRAMLEKCECSPVIPALTSSLLRDVSLWSPHVHAHQEAATAHMQYVGASMHMRPIKLTRTQAPRRLAAVVSSVLGNQVPVTVTALEAMARLLGVLEEVNADTRLVVYEPVMLKLTSACAAVRHQVPCRSEANSRCSAAACTLTASHSKLSSFSGTHTHQVLSNR